MAAHPRKRENRHLPDQLYYDLSSKVYGLYDGGDFARLTTHHLHSTYPQASFKLRFTGYQIIAVLKSVDARRAKEKTYSGKRAGFK